MTNKTRLLTYTELRKEKIKMARSTLWMLEKEGKFPLRRVHGGRVYWMESEVDEWLANLPTKQDQAA
ncbi:AlpA family transcriptional regulator [uncultured Thiothrix sp.]|mgnify:CR=1 FL=1|uniref:helix-turn-helix transcriptional regulator n=1 Tax=uncultured Thiothrix sp. TaxID=223185 RepID=UPI00261790B8|nr:AlpA family phage regulatory protein [uncultured Thiothrix sp.]HMT93080.1 AlpA family phage regulatory protein [Thiolinea sp.]